MNKRLLPEFEEFVYKGEKTPLSLGTLAVVIFCTTILIVATFTKIDIIHYMPSFSENGLSFILKKHSLIPQVPVVIMIAALLGARFGTFVIALYLICGFFIWPVFGFGGGLEYTKSYFFGYILGFFAATVFSGAILSKKYSVKNMLYSAFMGVISIHLCGIIYSFILSFFKSSFYNPDFHFIFAQIAYDFVFSLTGIFCIKPLKSIFWIAMKNETKRKIITKNG